MAVPRYGVREQRPFEDRLTIHLEELDLQGFTVLPSGFSHAELQAYRDSLKTLLARQAEACGGLAEMQRIGEGNLVRAPLAFDERFLAIATHPDVLAIVTRLMGEFVILMQQNGILNSPAQGPHGQSAFHRDLPYQHFVVSRPIAINALLCLDDFLPETGSTRVIPGSHKVEAFPTDAYVEKNAIPTRAPAGSFLVLNSMTYHAAGHNISSQERRAVNNLYTPPVFKQQISLPSLLNGKWADDPKLRRLLGYDTEPPRSVDEYLQGRASRVPPAKA